MLDQLLGRMGLEEGGQGGFGVRGDAHRLGLRLPLRTGDLIGWDPQHRAALLAGGRAFAFAPATSAPISDSSPSVKSISPSLGSRSAKLAWSSHHIYLVTLRALDARPEGPFARAALSPIRCPTRTTSPGCPSRRTRPGSNSKITVEPR